MDARLPSPLTFEGNVFQNFKKFRQNFEIYMEASGQNKKEDKMKVAILLNSIGEEGVEVFNTLKLNDNEKGDYGKVLSEIEIFFSQKKHVVYERFLFYSRKQRNGERFDHFLTDMRKLAARCEFAEPENMIRDIIIQGVHSKILQMELLQDEKLDMKKAISVCKVNESTHLQTKEVHGERFKADNIEIPGKSHWDYDHKSKTLYKRVRSVLNKLPLNSSQTFDTLMNEFQQLRIDINTKDRLQRVVDLVFDKAVDEPNCSAVCAKMCRKLQIIQVNAGAPGEDNIIVTFRTLLATKCQVKLEKQAADNTERNGKVNIINECSYPDKKKELSLKLEEYDRRLRMKSLRCIRFIGELFKQQMLTTNVTLNCLQTLIDNKDEESLECLCQLLTTVGEELETRKVNLSHIFDELKRIIDGKTQKVGNRIRFMLQDVTELRDSKWIPRRNRANPKTIAQIQEEADTEHLNAPAVNTPRKNHYYRRRRKGPRGGGGQPQKVSDGDSNSVGSSQNVRRQFSTQTDRRGAAKLTTRATSGSDTGTPMRNIGSTSPGSGMLPVPAAQPKPAYTPAEPAAPPTVPKLTEEQIQRRIHNSLNEYLTGCCTTNEYFEDIVATVPPSEFSKVVYESYNYIIEKSQPARLKTGELFAKLLRNGDLSLDHFIVGFQELLSFWEDLVIDIPQVWHYFAEDLVHLCLEEVLPIDKLQQLLECLISKNVGQKLLKPLFGLIVKEKGPNFLQISWQNSGMQLTNFMSSSEVDSFIKENNFEFLVDGKSSVGQTLLSYEEIQRKLSEFFKRETPFDDICNWISTTRATSGSDTGTPMRNIGSTSPGSGMLPVPAAQPKPAYTPAEPVAPPTVPKLTEEQIQRRIHNSLDEYLTGCCTTNEYFEDIIATVPPSEFSKVVYESYNYIIEKSQSARLKTGELFAKLLRNGDLSLDHFIVGFQELLSLWEDLVIDIPQIWHYFAEDLVHLCVEEVLPIDKLQQLLECLISKNVGQKLLKPLFGLIVKEKGPNFLQISWQNSGMQLTNFMSSSEVDSFIKENNFEFLVDGKSPVGQTLLSYEEIQRKLSEFFKRETPFDDICNWISENIGDRVKGNEFIRTLATAIFEDSISKDKPVLEVLISHTKIIQKYVDNNTDYELQCLYALQSLAHKLEHPQGLLLSICDKLYEDSTFCQESFIAWQNSTDPAEQEGKDVVLKQLMWFFTKLKGNVDEDYSSSSKD